jgi:hypothetical protein
MIEEFDLFRSASLNRHLQYGAWNLIKITSDSKKLTVVQFLNTLHKQHEKHQRLLYLSKIILTSSLVRTKHIVSN